MFKSCFKKTIYRLKFLLLKTSDNIPIKNEKRKRKKENPFYYLFNGAISKRSSASIKQRYTHTYATSV